MKRLTIPIIIGVTLILSASLQAQSIQNTVHNLSVSGPGTIKAESETEICVFCHTPHNASPVAPLWNRENPGTIYTLYSSSTIDASPGQPDGSSILCLSCHDGTIALGSVISRAQDITMSGGISTMPAGNTNLGTDLSDDHPVSIVYNTNLSTMDPELVDPTTLKGPVYLENEKVQCTSCHDPHKDVYGKFLVATNRNSDLCLYCHQKSGWQQSSHSQSSAQWNGSGTDPWYHTDFTTVSENACENCHNPHNANGHEFLMNQMSEEDNCLVCHNGNVATQNIETQLSKPYRHDVYAYSGVHNPEEAAVVQTKHVECVDCHNPHQAKTQTASAPTASGALTGVKGVDTNGNPVSSVQHQYEVCYRCHADSPNKPASPITRQIQQTNVRLEFDPNNPSFHPIEAQGANTNVPSLISPYTESSIIYCTDCHASDGNASGGPHGSIYPQILKYRYETADYTQESYQNYELCYQCHDRDQIINSMGKFGKRVHRKHIVGEDTPCSVCHDAHGISSTQGNSTNNTHLINFDVNVVSPNSSGRLEFVDRGNFSGECYLKCHGKNHNPKSY